MLIFFLIAGIADADRSISSRCRSPEARLAEGGAEGRRTRLFATGKRRASRARQDL